MEPGVLFQLHGSGDGLLASLTLGFFTRAFGKPQQVSYGPDTANLTA